MEVQSKQKLKKRRTRKNLNEIRERSRVGVKNNVNPSKLHIISKCSNIEQITSKRLTLALFNKTIKSETITRIPLSRVDHNISDNVNNFHNVKEFSDIFPTFSKHYQNSNNATSNSAVVWKKNSIATRSFIPQIQSSRSIQIDENNTSNSPILSPLKKLTEDSVSEVSSEEYKEEFLTDSSSNEDSENCLYENFMNDLPTYLTEHFPVLSKGVVNKNIPYLRKSYLEHCHQESQNNTLNGKITLNSPQNYQDSILEKPMDYIQKGSSWHQNMKKQHNLFVSSNSSSLLQFESNSNSTFVEDSPEYLYFPHKLNQ